MEAVLELPIVRRFEHISLTPSGHRWLLAVIGCFVFGLNLGATRLWDVDEAIFSEAAVEMMERGDLITPYYNGLLFAHKPPLMYWCQIAAFRVFGLNEFSARLFAAVFGVATVLLTYEIGRMLFNPRVGLWSGVILTGCVNFAVISRAATPDSPLTFFSTLALLFLILGRRSAEQHLATTETPTQHSALHVGWKYYAAAYLAMAVGTLVKGPVAIVMPMAVWGMYLLVEQSQTAVGVAGITDQTTTITASRWKTVWNSFLKGAVAFGLLFWPPGFCRTVWRMRPLTALGVLLMVAGPWYLAVGLNTNGEFLREFFLVHNVGRATGAMEHHSGSLLFYPVTICIGTFPWCVLLWPALVHLVRGIRENSLARSEYTLLACWCGVWVGCFTLVATKLANYVIPAFPGIALMIGVLVDSWLQERKFSRYRPWLNRGWITLAAVGVGCSVAILIATRLFLAGEQTPALIGIVPICGALCGWYQTSRGQLFRSLQTLAIAGLLFATGLLGYAILPIDAHKNTHELGDLIQLRSTGQPSIATYKYSPPSLVFYSRCFFDRLRSRDAVETYFRQHKTNAFLITTEQQVQHLLARLPSDFQVLRTERQFLKNQNIVVLGRSQNHRYSTHRDSSQTRNVGASSAN